MRGVGLSRVQTGGDKGRVAELINPDAGGGIVLVCEHACNHIPAELNGLGLGAEARESHIAWDPGAEALSCRLSELLQAPLVAGRISRLVYDCNRPPDSMAAVPVRSELYDIPGNAGLSDKERAARVRDYYVPFSALLSETMRKAPTDATLVTVHSFTPVYFHQSRAVEIGILHDRDARLADEMLASAADHSQHLVLRNEPYSFKDGVTHTLKVHGIKNGLANVMLEIRSDLIQTGEDQGRMAEMLCGWLSASLAALKADAEMA